MCVRYSDSLLPKLLFPRLHPPLRSPAVRAVKAPLCPVLEVAAVQLRLDSLLRRSDGFVLRNVHKRK